MSHISEQVFTAKCKHVAPELAVGTFKIDQLVLGRCGTLPPTRTCDKTDAWGQLTHTHTHVNNLVQLCHEYVCIVRATGVAMTTMANPTMKTQTADTLLV